MQIIVELVFFVTLWGLGVMEDTENANLEAIRARLSEEKARRLLLESDVEMLMLQDEKRRCERRNKEDLCQTHCLNKAGVAFTARLSKDLTHSARAVVPFDDVLVNEGNFYNPLTGKFTAPYRGLYLFSVTVISPPGQTVHCQLMKDDTEIGRLYEGETQANRHKSGSVTVVTVLDKGQEVYVMGYHGISVETIHGNLFTTFTGLLQMKYD
ncbi:hypothetical protein ACJMK2_025550 [Sinanodonta woodiana]|uniref:C1q domain-containing protein n=1 Tax=Sinanodonta woodiana TaxID=1069815 RepID=A0ABD3XGV7_SINWO